MDKEKLQGAINAMLDGGDAGNYYDELVTLLSVVDNANDRSIASAWSKSHLYEDEFETGGSMYEKDQAVPE